MRLDEISLSNYKSYHDPVSIEIREAFNIFVGANNSGKTTALEACDLVTRGNENIHRSIRNISSYGGQPTGDSSLALSISTTLSELIDLVGTTLMLPLPRAYGSGSRLERVWEKLRDDEGIKIDMDFRGEEVRYTVHTAIGRADEFSSGGSHADNTLYVSNARSPTPVLQIRSVSGNGSLLSFSDIFRKFFYRFSAQRTVQSSCQSTGFPVFLEPNGTNLAYCISQLQLNDAHGHEMLCEWINKVFPAIHWVQAPQNGKEFVIQCLPRPKRERREDLAVPLAHMGTGVGNVIAILYIVLSARHPRLIAIDEPNSFLHPRALRTLLQILASEGRQHQYILTAHSPDVLIAVTPSMVSVFDTADGQTQVVQAEGHSIATLRSGLSELGIRMTDLHARDRVLWVEGQTEELVIPELLKYFCSDAAPGTAVLRVVHTSKFDKKGTEVQEVVDAYERLTSHALVPPAVSIIIDTERRSAKACRELERNTRGRLRFLPEMMIENYVLFPDAIVAVLSQHGVSVTAEMAEVSLDKHKQGKEEVDGARILKDVFDDLSGSTVEFRKTTHVPALMRWLLDEYPDRLAALGGFLQSLFGKTSAALAP